MSDRPSILLKPVEIRPGSPEFADVAGWAFADAFVGRLLRTDIPQRIDFGRCRMWVYRDADGQDVGFGTLDICLEYAHQTGGQPHAYLPLLAVNPASEGRGYGQAIVRHLSDEATILALEGRCHETIYLDAYTTSVRAIGLYKKCGFAEISPEPLADPGESGQLYVIMAKRLKVASKGLSLFMQVEEPPSPGPP